MAAAEASDTSDRITCSVCHEYYIDPKLLPCGHLLCQRCLLSWMQANKAAGCPLCRSRVVEGDCGGSESLEDVAEDLPTDLSMVRLVEAERLLNKQHQCCACEQVVATSLCLNCREMMCESCAKIHTKFAMAKSHVIEELCNLTAEKLAADPRSATCTYHTSEVCGLYCPAHDESMCHLCAVTRHRSCQEIKELEEKMCEARGVLAELVSRLSEGQSAVSQGIQELEQHLQETEKRTQALLREIDATCDRLDAAIKECRRHLKELVHKSSAEVREAVQDGKTQLLQRKGKVTCHKIVTERVQEMKAHRDVPTMTTVMKARVDHMDLSGTLPAGAKLVPAVTLEISMEAVSSCEKMLKELGQVRCSPAVLKALPEVTWNFHDHCGKDIVLSNNKQTACRSSEFHNGIVMARDPMERDTLYQVEMNEVLSNWNYQYGVLGVTVQAPHTISLPSHVSGGLSCAVLIDYSRVLNQGTKKASGLGASLRGVRAGSRVGLLVDGQGNLHLYVDGTDRGVFASAVPQPCYVLIDLQACWKKVTTLPLERVR